MFGATIGMEQIGVAKDLLNQIAPFKAPQKIHDLLHAGNNWTYYTGTQQLNSGPDLNIYMHPPTCN